MANSFIAGPTGRMRFTDGIDYQFRLNFDYSTEDDAASNSTILKYTLTVEGCAADSYPNGIKVSGAYCQASEGRLTIDGGNNLINTASMKVVNGKILASGQKKITHNDDGTKTVPISFGIKFNNTDSVSYNGNIVLTSFSRYATIIVDNITDNVINYRRMIPKGKYGAIHIYVNHPNNANQKVLSIWENISKVGDGNTLSGKRTLNNSERESIYNNYTTQKSCTIHVDMETYDVPVPENHTNSTHVDAKEKDFKFLASDLQPSFSLSAPEKEGANGKKYTISNKVFKYNASFSSITVTLNNNTFKLDKNSYTNNDTNFIITPVDSSYNGSGEVRPTVTLKDTRGFEYSVTGDVAVYTPYKSPKIIEAYATRVRQLEDKTYFQDSSGDKVLIHIKAKSENNKKVGLYIFDSSTYKNNTFKMEDDAYVLDYYSTLNITTGQIASWNIWAKDLNDNNTPIGVPTQSKVILKPSKVPLDLFDDGNGNVGVSIGGYFDNNEEKYSNRFISNLSMKIESKSLGSEEESSTEGNLSVAKSIYIGDKDEPMINDKPVSHSLVLTQSNGAGGRFFLDSNGHVKLQFRTNKNSGWQDFLYNDGSKVQISGLDLSGTDFGGVINSITTTSLKVMNSLDGSGTQKASISSAGVIDATNLTIKGSSFSGDTLDLYNKTGDFHFILKSGFNSNINLGKIEMNYKYKDESSEKNFFQIYRNDSGVFAQIQNVENFYAPIITTERTSSDGSPLSTAVRVSSGGNKFGLRIENPDSQGNSGAGIFTNTNKTDDYALLSFNVKQNAVSNVKIAPSVAASEIQFGKSGSGIGSTSEPVYIDSTGKFKVCTNISATNNSTGTLSSIAINILALLLENNAWSKASDINYNGSTKTVKQLCDLLIDELRQVQIEDGDGGVY